MSIKSSIRKKYFRITKTGSGTSENIQKFYQQGMVTRNEVIRGELAIKTWTGGILTLTNNKKILNYNLNIALGLSSDTEIIPTESLENKESGIGMEYYTDLAHESNPLLKSAQKKNIAVADKNIEIIKRIMRLRWQGSEDIRCKDRLQQETLFWICIQEAGRPEFL